MFIAKLDSHEFAIKFQRERDRRTICTIKMGPIGTRPRDMVVVSSGTCSRRNPKDQFDKGIAQAISLSNAMRRIRHTDGIQFLSHEKRQRIAMQHREALRKHGVKTRLPLV
jgi:hypothetical protein